MIDKQNKSNFHTQFYNGFNNLFILIFPIIYIIQTIGISFATYYISLTVILKIILITFLIVGFILTKTFPKYKNKIAYFCITVAMFYLVALNAVALLISTADKKETIFFAIGATIIINSQGFSSLKLLIIYSIYASLIVIISFSYYYGFSVGKVIGSSLFIIGFLSYTIVLLNIRIKISNSLYYSTLTHEKLYERLEEYTKKLESSESMLFGIFSSNTFKIAVIDVNKFTYIKVNNNCFSTNELKNYMMKKTDKEYCQYLNLDDKIWKNRQAAMKKSIETSHAVNIIETLVDKNNEITIYSRTYKHIINNVNNSFILMTALDITENLNIYNNINDKKIDTSGIPKRQYIESIIKSKIQKNKLFTLAIININNFRKVNAEFGFEYGDKLFKIIAKTISTSIRNDDYIGRLTSDEMIICFNNIQSENELSMIINNIFNNIDSIAKSFNKHIKISVSIGTTSFPKDGENYSFLLKCADLALHQNRDKSKNNFNIYKKENFS